MSAFRHALAALALLATISILAFRFTGLSTREFDPDELEHSHVAWLITQGDVPYLDFFEMHMPLFYYPLAAVFASLDPAESGDAALRALVVARRATWTVSLILVALTWLLARQMRGSTAAWLAMPLTAFSITVALRAPEIRPDGLSTCLWLACLLAFDAAIRHPRQQSAAAASLFVA